VLLPHTPEQPKDALVSVLFSKEKSTATAYCY
jgi:hypothetical protein